MVRGYNYERGPAFFHGFERNSADNRKFCVFLAFLYEEAMAIECFNEDMVCQHNNSLLSESNSKKLTIIK